MFSEAEDTVEMGSISLNQGICTQKREPVDEQNVAPDTVYINYCSRAVLNSQKREKKKKQSPTISTKDSYLELLSTSVERGGE